MLAALALYGPTRTLRGSLSTAPSEPGFTYFFNDLKLYRIRQNNGLVSVENQSMGMATRLGDFQKLRPIIFPLYPTLGT